MKYPLLFVVLAGCSAVELEPFTPTAAVADAPLQGVDATVDSADTACYVILREVNAGTVAFDVARSAILEDAVPSVLYKTASGWHSLVATTNGTMLGGFQRFDATLPEPASELIPYLQLQQGGRLFDHNKNYSAFSTYPASDFVNDAALCPIQNNAVADVTVRFLKDGQVERDGAFKPGTIVSLQYDLDRSSQCRGTHNGYPAWDTVAYVRIQPSGKVISQSVRAFQSNYGTPTNVADPVPFVFRIPDDATRVEIWFENSTGAGSTCKAYDSNYGADFTFYVQQPVGWFGNVTVLTTRDTAYTCGDRALVSANYDTWTRQRAAIANVCFDVWQAGVTDVDDAMMWQKLDAKVRYRFPGETAWRSAYANWQAREGNNARYAISLKDMDPFNYQHCTPVQTTVNGQYREAKAELEVVVNGVALSGFAVTFSDYVSGGSCP